MIEFNYRGIYKVFNEFKKRYPQLVRRGMSYEPYDQEAITVYIPGVGKLIYENMRNRITWLEQWKDETLIKHQEKEHRPEMYGRFCTVVSCYMRDNRITHQEFADTVGVSRQMLSKYLNGDAIPKVSTMKRICKTIHIDI